MGAPIPTMPGLAPASADVVASFQGAQALAPRLNGVAVGSRNLVGGLLGVPFTPTSWSISKSSTMDLGWKDKGVFVAHLDMTNDDDGATVHVVIRAYLVMASKGSPLGFDFSLPSDTSVGGRIVRGLSGTAFSKGSFFGPCGVSMYGMNLAHSGAGITLFQFGWAPIPPGMCNGFCVTMGVQHGLPSIGVASGAGVATPA
jgi:hypothetical protein